MGVTVSIMSPKGGVGKSTLSILLATALYHKKELRVMVLDADEPQHSVMKKRQRDLQIIARAPKRLELYEALYSERPPYPIIGCSLDECPSLFQKYKDQYDIILVDTPRLVQQSEQHPFFKEINYFFIPLIPEELAFVETYRFYTFLQKKIMPFSDHFKRCLIILNKVQAHHKLSSVRRLFRGADIMEKGIQEHSYYEQEGRNTLFPMASDRKETKRFEDFLEDYLEMIYLASIEPYYEELMLKT